MVPLFVDEFRRSLQESVLCAALTGLADRQGLRQPQTIRMARGIDDPVHEHVADTMPEPPIIAGMNLESPRMKPVKLGQQQVGERIHGLAIGRRRQSTECSRAQATKDVCIDGRNVDGIQGPDVVGRDEFGFKAAIDATHIAEIAIDQAGDAFGKRLFRIGVKDTCQSRQLRQK